MNATLLAEEIRVAIRPKVLPSKKTVGREEMRRLVRRVMVNEEGNAIRKKEDCKVRLLEEPTRKKNTEKSNVQLTSSRMNEPHAIRLSN
ncbi:hypothetical protein CRG98_049872 [Punica granatum]|uniref:Uncharacterized protein n=1 Tax=Punica granatum TaxID=22663 RepID=A0A2I0H1R1_PUNGR|nr:hypothetical protein CRG98_049872 [Punica granatum]